MPALAKRDRVPWRRQHSCRVVPGVPVHRDDRRTRARLQFSSYSTRPGTWEQWDPGSYFKEFSLPAGWNRRGTLGTRATVNAATTEFYKSGPDIMLWAGSPLSTSLEFRTNPPEFCRGASQLLRRCVASDEAIQPLSPRAARPRTTRSLQRSPDHRRCSSGLRL